MLLLVSLLFPWTAQTRPLNGFHEGPYFQLVSGARDASFDTNIADGTKNARDIEPAFGFIFGWNLTDPLSVEMQGTYSTAGIGNVQQHLIDARMSGRYVFITNALTHFASLRILPFVDTGFKLQINILPNASGATSARVIQSGVGPSVGGGVSALFYHDTIYLTARGGADILRRKQITQTIAATPTTVYPGEWGVDWSATMGLGVHF